MEYLILQVIIFFGAFMVGWLIGAGKKREVTILVSKDKTVEDIIYQSGVTVDVCLADDFLEEDRDEAQED